MTTALSQPVITSGDLAAQIAQFSLVIKAEHVLSIDVHYLTSFTDQFVIFSSDTHIQVKAIADSIRTNTDHKPIRTEGN